MSVTVIGDAFIDIIVPAYDIKPGETHHRKIITLCGGTANVAVGIAKLGEKPKFIGKVGNDLFGRYFKENLKKEGVQDLTFIDNEHPTGLCVSMAYKKGERTMVANRGANDYLKKEEIRNCIDEIIKSKIVYFSGYSLLSKENAESILYAIKECHKQNCEVYFNPGAPNLIKEGFKKIIHHFVDILIMNMEEAKNMTGKNSVEDIVKSLNNLVNISIITVSDGCIIQKGDKCIYIETEKLNVLDTTGAGDAFSAGFIVGRLKGEDEEECARLANKVAAKFLREKMEILK